MALRSMGFACPSIGNVFRPSAAEEQHPNNGCSNPNSPAASQRTPSRSRRSLAFLRDRGAASIGALRGWKSGASGGGGEVSDRPASSGRSETVDAVASAPRTRGGAASTSATGSAGTSSQQRNGEGSTPPPTPPPASHPPAISIPATSLGNPQGVASRPAASHRLAARTNQGGLTPPRAPPVRVGPADEEGYHDMVLPCGLYQDEVIDIMYRDLSPEDFEALSKLDERVPKRNTARWNIVDRLPRVAAGECGVTECGVCLAELEATVSVAKLPCRHAFHPNCISRWLTQCKNTCPLCQAPIQQPQQQMQQPQQQQQQPMSRGSPSAPQAPVPQYARAGASSQQQLSRGGMAAQQAAHQAHMMRGGPGGSIPAPAMTRSV